MDIIAAIDAATGCQHCGGPLGDSPSDDFCSATCQAAWSAARTTPLPHDDEPVELSAHVFNATELHHPETCADCTEGRWCPDRPFATLVDRSRTVEVSGPFGPVVSLLAEDQAEEDARRLWLNHRVVADEVPLAHFLVDEDGTVRANGVIDRRLVLNDFQGPAYVRAHGVVGVDPSGDVIVRPFHLAPWQRAWLVNAYAHGQLRALTGHIAARVASPVATPAPDALDRGGVPEGFEIYVASALRQLIESHISEQMNEVVAAPWQPAEITFTALETDWDMIQRYYRNEPVELHEPAEPTDPRARALWLRQHRNTGPTRQRRTPRAINARRTR